MPDYVLLSESKTYFSSSDRRMIRSKLAEIGNKNSISVDTGSLTGRPEESLMDLEYRWEINASEGRYELVERQYIERRWLHYLLASIFLAALGFVFAAISADITSADLYEKFSQGEPIWPYIAVEYAVPPLLLTSGFLLVIVLTTYITPTGLVPLLRGSTEGYESNSAFVGQIIAYCTGTGFGFVGFFLDSLLMMIISSISLFALFLALSYDPQFFQDLSGEVLDLKIVSGLPPVVGEYLLIPLPAFAPLIVIWVGLEWISESLFVVSGSLLLFVVVSVAQLKWIGTIVSGEAVLDAFYDIKQGKRSKGSSLRLILGVVAVGLSYSIFGFILANLSRYSAYFTSSVSLALLFVIAVFPSTYFVAGLFYQTFHSIGQKIRLLQNSRRLEVSSISSTVLLDTSDELESPASLSTGFRHYVIIPEKIADALDKNELRAVIAHEQKHIESGEAFLSFVIPVLSILLLTGQNVIYSLLNFRQREFDADQIAADQVGEENVISALQKISKLVDQQTEKPSFWQEYFGMFYGTFALSQAHPSLSERIQSLSE